MTISEASVTAVDPRSGEALGSYPQTPVSEVAAIADRAMHAFGDPRLHDPARRVAALRGAAAALRASGAELRELCQAESGLPPARAAGELERTCVQLELFAEVIGAGDHLEIVIDSADADARPVARPDLRRMLVPIGPVVVFGASNFPLAFGVGGGDTAAALAAGCPVIAKGHPSQPGVNELVGERLAEAIAQADLPPAALATVQGTGRELGEALVDAEAVCAVAFTGSARAGRALYDRGARRARPIPVYAEMGSVNPAVVTQAALRARADEIRAGLLTAVTGAAGQLCTKPGVVFVPAGPEGDAFVAELVTDLEQAPAGVMLNAGLLKGFTTSLERMIAEPGVQALTDEPEGREPGFRHHATAFSVDAATLALREQIREECFGPAVVLARYGDDGELLAALESFDGQLAAAVFAEIGSDGALVRQLTSSLAARVGRLVFDAYPTGVAVSWAMEHGGPYPATTSAGHTSVGLTSTRRFMRPVCWQSAPTAALPAPLRDENPSGLWRRIDGVLTTASLGPAAIAR